MNPVLNMESSNRLFTPFKYSEETTVNGKDLTIKYTKRAKKALAARNAPLIIEMQIYFSCVVQKRVLFHESFEHETIPVNDKITVAIRSVESESCDPEYYASNHPEKRVLDSSGAKKMSARELILDYKNSEWIGCFSIV
ncbi:hypothetical protein MNBD_GAMMA11-1889 [hydrothermal vent metagenome]|uniref:Uncharacterized protein n=1 Tax=hydrothermal vent metagenome TaxID=652676 RepID=A0A3B0X7N4_9ZZZZ